MKRSILVESEKFKVVEFQCLCGCWVNYGGPPKVVDRDTKDETCRECQLQGIED